jgi:hypothetical protein
MNRRIFLPEISACCQDRNDQHTSDKHVFVHSDLRLRETNRSGLYMWKFIMSSPNVTQRSLRHPGHWGGGGGEGTQWYRIRQNRPCMRHDGIEEGRGLAPPILNLTED